MRDSVVVWAIILVLFGHWVFDFVLQPHWMSMRKSKEWNVLGLHALRITTGGLIAGIIIGLVNHWPNNSFIVGDALAWATLNGAAHFAIDAVTSRMTSRLWVEGRTHEFFVVIGFDQFLHVALALSTLAWLVL